MAMEYIKKDVLMHELMNNGVHENMKLIVQVSTNFSNQVLGGNQMIIEILQTLIGQQGVLITPTFTYDMLDVTSRDDIDYDDWNSFRNEIVGFRKELSETNAFGNQFLKNKSVIRSNHPINSFAYWGNIDSSKAKVNINFPIQFEDDIYSELLLGVSTDKSLLIYSKSQGVTKLQRARIYRKSGSVSRLFLCKEVENLDYQSMDIQSFTLANINNFFLSSKK